MAGCLVTTLKGVVNDDTLPYIGDFTLTLAGEKAQSFSDCPILNLTSTESFTVIAHDGNVTDSSGNPYGSEKVFEKGTVSVGFSAETTSVTIRAKYKLTGISAPVNRYIKRYISLKNSDIQWQKQLTSLAVCGGLRSIGYTDDLSELIKGREKLRSLSIINLSQTVDLNQLSKAVNLKSLSISETKLSGDIASLNAAQNLTTVYLAYLPNKITGDLAKAPPVLELLRIENSSSAFSWDSTRSSELMPFAMMGVNLGTYVDAALNNLAQSTKPFYSDTWPQTMRIKGTRTSASDAAVATLQAKGWTITITEA